MSVLDSINSLSDDIKTMQTLLDKNGISYKNDIGHPLDDVVTISNYVNELEIENQRIEMLEENIEDYTEIYHGKMMKSRVLRMSCTNYITKLII